MITTIGRQAVEVRLGPAPGHRRFRFEEIAGASSGTYRPIRGFGGWRFRGGGRKRRAYSTPGDETARPIICDGSRRTTRRQRAHELEAAIQARRPRS